jgi:hypothetical protein
MTGAGCSAPAKQSFDRGAALIGVAGAWWVISAVRRRSASLPSRAQDSRQPEVREHAGVGKPSDLRDPIVLERENEQPVRPCDLGLGAGK